MKDSGIDEILLKNEILRDAEDLGLESSKKSAFLDDLAPKKGPEIAGTSSIQG